VPAHEALVTEARFRLAQVGVAAGVPLGVGGPGLAWTRPLEPLVHELGGVGAIAEAARAELAGYRALAGLTGADLVTAADAACAAAYRPGAALCVEQRAAFERLVNQQAAIRAAIDGLVPPGRPPVEAARRPAQKK
jgi:hypothetical protein